MKGGPWTLLLLLPLLSMLSVFRAWDRRVYSLWDDCMHEEEVCVWMYVWVCACVYVCECVGVQSCEVREGGYVHMRVQSCVNVREGGYVCLCLYVCVACVPDMTLQHAHCDLSKVVQHAAHAGIDAAGRRRA